MPKLILNNPIYSSSILTGTIYMEIFMAYKQAIATYTKTENDYIKGIETPMVE